MNTYKLTLPFPITYIDIIDILIVAYIVYQMLTWFKGTRALQLLRGLLLLFLLFVFSEFGQFTTIVWLLRKVATIVVIALLIVFQPELRKALEHLGRGKLINRLFFPHQGEGWLALHQVLKAVEELAKTKTGAIIALERNTGLNEFMESGVTIDARVHSELIVSLFNKKSPLHDGAMIVQGDRIAAVSCFLPLSETMLTDKRLGTRHQAALGLSEVTDSPIIIVSEQTGTISLAENGSLVRPLSIEQLEEKLSAIYGIGLADDRSTMGRWFAEAPGRSVPKKAHKKRK